MFIDTHTQTLMSLALVLNMLPKDTLTRIYGIKLVTSPLVYNPLYLSQESESFWCQSPCPFHTDQNSLQKKCHSLHCRGAGLFIISVILGHKFPSSGYFDWYHRCARIIIIISDGSFLVSQYRPNQCGNQPASQYTAFCLLWNFNYLL